MGAEIAESQLTLLMIKPEGVVRGLVGEIISRLERKGLKLVGLKLIKLTQDQASRLYGMHAGKHFFQELIYHVTSGPVVCIALKGRNAVQVVRNLLGATDPAQAQPGTIRGDFGLELGSNIAHAPDSPEAAAKELSILFQKSELILD